MSEIDVVCPSGLSGRVRGLKAKELNILSDRRAVRSGEALDRILRACWLETKEAGPYTFDGDPEWDRALQCDRFFTLMKIRIATYPEESYPFDVQCSNPVCSKKIQWEVDLEDLPVKALPKESIDKVKAQQFFESQVAGKTVKWKLATGREEKKVSSKAAAPAITTAMRLRIWEVEGLDKRQIDAWLEDLEVSDCRDLLNEFEEADGGVETSIDIECDGCYTEQSIDLPFSAAFFIPRSQKKPAEKLPGKKKRKSTRTG